MQKAAASGQTSESSQNHEYAPPPGTPDREALEREQNESLLAELQNGTQTAERTRRVHCTGSIFTSQAKHKNGSWTPPRPTFPGKLPKLSRHGRAAAERIRRVHRSTALPHRARGCSGRPPTRKPNRRSGSARSRAPGDEGESEGDGHAGLHPLNAPLYLAGLLLRCAVARGVSLEVYADGVRAACAGDLELLGSFSAVLATAKGMS